MEHRWSMRKPITNNVMLKGTPFGVIQVRAKDISLGGMYVDTGKKPLHVNATVDLAFMDTADGEQQVCVVPAVVVRTTAEGAGLMFHRFAPSTFHMLGSMLLNE